VTDAAIPPVSVTDAEFLKLWSLRYMRGDRTMWPGVTVDRFLTVVDILRGNSEGLEPYEKAYRRR
jgi:hypothetical protein